MQIDTFRATYMYGAQFQNRKFFSRNNNASDEQFSLALQYVSSLAPPPLPDKETRGGAFVPPSRILDVLKSPVKVGLSTRGLVQKNLRGHFGSGKKIMPTSFSHAKLHNLTQ